MNVENAAKNELRQSKGEGLSGEAKETDKIACAGSCYDRG